MVRQIFHIEDESPVVQVQVYRSIREAEYLGIQLTHLDFTVDGEGFVFLDALAPSDWLEAMRME